MVSTRFAVSRIAALLLLASTATSETLATRIHVRISSPDAVGAATTPAPSSSADETITTANPLLEVGKWEPLDAALYKLSACAPQSWNVTRKGASSIALRFSSADISPDDQLIVSAEDGSSPQQVGSSSLTTLPISGSTVKLEFRPSTKGCKATGKAPSFALEALGFEWPENKIINKESVCGKNTFKDAVCFKMQYPDEYEASRAVARTVFTSGNSSFLCTVWLWGNKGHLVSNNHCFSSQQIVDTARFEFLFQASTCNQTCPLSGCPIAETLVAKGNVRFIKSDPKLDYSVLQITNNAKHYVDKYGYLQLRNGNPRLRERIYIPQHPAGKPKKIAITDDDNDSKAATITRLNQKVRTEDNITMSGLVGYQADTEGGSSGSPVILRGSNLVVALHHHGGCANTGTPSNLLYQPFRAISSTNDGFAKEGDDNLKDDNKKGDSDSGDDSDDDDDDDSDGDEE